MKALIALYRDVLAMLPTGAKRFINLYSTLLGLLAILDALALGLLAMVASPLGSGNPVILPGIGEVKGTGLFVAIGAIGLLTIVKGMLSVALLWWATRRSARYELEIGSRLFRSYVSAPWIERLKKNSADIVRMTDVSVEATISLYLLPGATLIGEALSLSAVILVLALFKPIIAITTLVYLGGLGAILYFWVARHSGIAGAVNLEYSHRVQRLIHEMVGAMKELTLRNKTGEIADVVREGRVHTTRARSNYAFLSQVPRFVLESGIMGGFILVGIVGYLVGGTSEALTAVALFALAGFRMAPSVVRFQGVVAQMNAFAPQARSVIDEIHSTETANQARRERPSATLAESPTSLELKNVSFRYPGARRNAVDKVNVTIPFGHTVAIVGSSGSGKSTLVDLILGLLEPTSGRISIDGTPLTSLAESWGARVGYVPQDVSLFDATVAQNVALTWKGEIDRDQVRNVLARAQLLRTIESRDGGLDAIIGERGLALSGGQRQRLGIARALYARPMVLVLDEATSALDTETEAEVTEAIKGLKGQSTMILVAHRLATVMHSDQIFFMRDGQVAAQGTFNELVSTMPDFARQAALAGLT